MITIRATEHYDYQGFYDLYRTSQVASQLLHLPNRLMRDWEQLLDKIPDNVHSFVAVVDSDEAHQMVGNIALTVATNPRQAHKGELIIAVCPDFQNQGIGSQLMQTVIDLADNWLNLKRMELTVYTDNEKAIALYQKFGFVIEGEHQAFAFKNGKFVNAYAMARMKA
ncbi:MULTISPECIES: GNAT family N-acetyltransferase [unclassified Moraxella]|uniref:GNAT family N-acetyltransferase n=1 Tax=unclassified Moraxella TaxID=2685852 RepID=UPI00359CD8F7